MDLCFAKQGLMREARSLPWSGAFQESATSWPTISASRTRPFSAERLRFSMHIGATPRRHAAPRCARRFIALPRELTTCNRPYRFPPTLHPINIDTQSPTNDTTVSRLLSHPYSERLRRLLTSRSKDDMYRHRNLEPKRPVVHKRNSEEQDNLNDPSSERHYTWFQPRQPVAFSLAPL